MKNSADISTALHGVSVVSIALNLPGPTCARRLADFGATVIKIEPPALLGGDPLGQYARGYYDELHCGIDIRELNLKTTADRAALDALLATTDVFITSQREAALVRLQLDWPTVSKRFPQLCQIAIVGSETQDDAGHDLTYISAAGLATPPQLPTTLIADLAGAERAVAATFAALRLKQQDGCGRHLVVSLEAAANAFARPHQHGLTSSGGLLAGQNPGYNFYQASDGWIALAALEPHFAARVAAETNVPLTVADLRAHFSEHSVRHWQDWALQHDIPLAILPKIPPTASQ